MFCCCANDTDYQVPHEDLDALPGYATKLEENPIQSSRVASSPIVTEQKIITSGPVGLDVTEQKPITDPNQSSKVAKPHLVCRDPENYGQEVVITSGPVGLDVTKQKPITVRNVHAGYIGERLGIKAGWIVELANDPRFQMEPKGSTVAYDAIVEALRALPKEKP